MTDKELDDLEAQLRERWSPGFPIPNSMLEDAADAIAELRKKNAGLVVALSELHAVVEGECPSLFNEDSGGDAKLAIEIENLLKEEPQ